MSEKIEWTEETLATLEKAPEFARAMAREMIEDFVRGKGERVVTPELMKQARAKFGM